MSEALSETALLPVVAMDGPAGSGKSTVARRVAQELRWRYVDTGATYRALTLAVLRTGLDVGSASREQLTAVALDAVQEVVLGTDPGAPSVHLSGEDVTDLVRGAEVTAAVSAVAGLPDVRVALLEIQRDAVGTTGAVAEGRDVASVVCPRAAVKVYVDADPAVRAARRAADVHSGAESADLQVVDEALARRDRADSRTTPLRPEGGAVVIDTSDRTIDQVVDAVLQLVAQAGLTA